MWSPFAPIRSTVAQVLGFIQDGVEALRGILVALLELQRTIQGFEFPESAPAAPIDEERIVALGSRIDDLTLAVKEGVNNVQRSERRVRAVVASARRELAEAGFAHPGLEAESGELEPVDGDGGEAESVLAVPESLGRAPHDASPIAGVTMDQMRTARRRRR